MMAIDQTSRLFLPLTSQAFEWYDLNKNVEVRRYQGRFKNILKFNYKFAELRRGYSGESKFASIEEILVFNNPHSLLDKIDFKRVVPIATSRTDAERIIFDYVGSEGLIAIFLSINH